MSDATQPKTRAVAVRLSADEDARLARLIEHFSGETPDGFRAYRPSDVLRVALNRLYDAELGSKKKARK